jgi:cytochrome c biogenesis protein CcdA
VFGLDDHIAELGQGHGLPVALALAVLLGLRHATDPDHLTAVSTLVLSERGGTRRAAGLGLAWGAGHGLTLLVLGLPVVLFSRSLPNAVQRAAEVAIGLVIVALGVRLLIRWHRGYLHVHPHDHAGVRHAHPHVHLGVHERSGHDHAHAERLGRSPMASFGIGLVHGVGGSAGVGILLIGAISNQTEAVVALVLFAAATAFSMALLSSAFGAALSRRSSRRRFELLAPAFGVVALLFGVWYALGATGAVPYAL